jgi:hypothetical protein
MHIFKSTGDEQNDILNTLDTNTHTPTEPSNPKRVSQGLLSSNSRSCGYPSLCYEYVEDIEKLEMAYDAIFEEALLISLTGDSHEPNQIDRGVRESFNN